jgi:hypothetical protein
MDSAAQMKMRFALRLPREKWHRRLLFVVLGVAFLVWVLSFGLDEPIRRHVEQQMNANLKGYTAHVRGLRFHPFNFALTLKDTSIVQDKDPDPPVADFPRLDASVHWRALLHLRLVADFRFDRPKIHVDRTHVEVEAKDKVPVQDRGWQQALESIYPLKINEFVIRNGEITYIEDTKSKPLHVDQVNFRATNIRNIRSRERTYPSEVWMTGRIFDSGKLAFDGNADFLAEPYAGVKGSLSLADTQLDPLKPVLERYNLTVQKGRLSFASNVEFSPKVKMADVSEIKLRDLDAGYIVQPARAAAAEEMREKTAEAAKEVSNDPGILIKVDHVRGENARIRYINEEREPHYQLELDDTAISVENVSNHAKRGPATGEINGRFQGSGPAHMKFTFRPDQKAPNFDLAVEITDTELTTLNDLFRAYGNFDVAEGKFSFFTELSVHDNRIDGYVKPMFADIKVYDAQQDKEKTAFHKVYEGLVGGAAKLLENRPRDQVATKVTITGPVDNPKMSTLQIVLKLIQNAFFKAILPGFEEEVRGRA